MLVNSLEKVGIGQEMEPLEKWAPLSVLYGETLSFQAAFRFTGFKDIGEIPVSGMGVRMCVRARWDMAGAEGKDWPKLCIRQVLPVMCRRGCDPESADGDYLFYDERPAPDLLRDIGCGETSGEGECRILKNGKRDLSESGEAVRGGDFRDGGEGDCQTFWLDINPQGNWQSLWVDVCPDEGQEPGSYHLTLSFSLAGEEAAECGMDIRVIGGRLPRLPIVHTEWFHCDGIADYYGVDVFSEEFWRIFKNFLKVYVKRGCNTMLVPVVTPPLDTGVGLERTTVQLVDVELADGEYRFDFGKLNYFLDICLSGGIEYFEICHLFTQWGAEAAPKVEATVDGERRRIFGWDTSSDDPEYLKFLAALLPALKGVLKGWGLLLRTFFHISDEPNLNSVHYQAAQKAVRQLLEGCTIVEAVSDYVYYEKGLVDIPICATNHVEPFLEKRPPELWTYYCCAQTKEVPNRFISMPSWRNRIYGVLLYWHRIGGFLHWGFNFYNSACSRKRIDPYETADADGAFPAGDPFLVYPGRDGIPEESIRIMVQDEAIADYRALYSLEAYIGRDGVMELIRQEAGMELSFCRYPRNAEFILRLRERVNRLLEERGIAY